MIRCPSLIADTYLSWMPAFSTRGFVVILLACAVAWIGLQTIWGASQVRRRFGLWVLRGCSLLVLGAILLGPTIVDEQAGEVTRPNMMYLIDGSQSMQLGQETTRWEESLRFISEAEAAAGVEHSGNCQAFRFGHRLLPLSSPASGRTG